MTKTERPADTLAPATNFKLSVEERLNAYVQGVPGYIRRRRRIEDVEARLLAKLAEAETASETMPAIVTSAELAADLTLLNELIAKHNRYYPIEANLAIELRTGRLLERGAPWRPLQAVTVADLLARAAAR
jgi:hypothetical protein